LDYDFCYPASPVIGKDGNIYVGAWFGGEAPWWGYLYAFGPGEPNNPPTVPTIEGPSLGVKGTEYSYSFFAVDPEDDPVSFFVKWGDYTKTGWTEEYASGERVIINHTWSEPGSYEIFFQAKDAFDNEGDWGSLRVKILPNSPPSKPTISGPRIGRYGNEYEYTFVSYDPDGDYVSYFVDWGDGTSTWTKEYPADRKVILTHRWSRVGTYRIKAKAKDSYGDESGFSTLKVIMPKELISTFLQKTST
jgi:hypothetical protein